MRRGRQMDALPAIDPVRTVIVLLALLPSSLVIGALERRGAPGQKRGRRQRQEQFSHVNLPPTRSGAFSAFRRLERL